MTCVKLFSTTCWVSDYIGYKLQACRHETQMSPPLESWERGRTYTCLHNEKFLNKTFWIKLLLLCVTLGIFSAISASAADPTELDHWQRQRWGSTLWAIVPEKMARLYLTGIGTLPLPHTLFLFPQFSLMLLKLSLMLNWLAQRHSNMEQRRRHGGTCKKCEVMSQCVSTIPKDLLFLCPYNLTDV